MKPAPFEYYCPRTMDEALELLANHGSDAKPLAGGQSLIPAMNFRLATPAVLVDINAIDGLGYITADAGSALRIGAMSRHRDLERSSVIAQQAPLVAQAMPYIAHAAIRTRGTLGGSLAHADPAAELPAVMLAVNASLTLMSRGRSRTVPADDFFIGLFTTAAEPGELLTEITIPAAPPGANYAFQEISRRHGDFALAGVAAMLALDENGTVTEARIALLSVGDRPIRAKGAEALLLGHTPSSEAIRAAADAAAENDVDPPGDIHASSRYRRQLVRTLTRRALETLTHTS
jgi:carbon-monoxide dehydrogenase medium subunit